MRKRTTPRKRPPRKNEGRPTKYGPEVLEKTKDYLENYESYGDAIPSQVGLALELDIVPSTLYEWQTDPEKPEFSRMLEKIKAKQERVLLAGSLFGDLNANISKLVLAKHGYAEKTEVENKGTPQLSGLTIIHGKEWKGS